MEIDGAIHDDKFKTIKDRSEMLRTMKENNLQKENEKMGEKIVTK